MRADANRGRLARVIFGALWIADRFERHQGSKAARAADLPFSHPGRSVKRVTHFLTEQFLLTRCQLNRHGLSYRTGRVGTKTQLRSLLKREHPLSNNPNTTTLPKSCDQRSALPQRQAGRTALGVGRFSHWAPEGPFTVPHDHHEPCRLG